MIHFCIINLYHHCPTPICIIILCHHIVTSFRIIILYHRHRGQPKMIQNFVSSKCVITLYHPFVSSKCILSLYRQNVSPFCVIILYHHSVFSFRIIEMYVQFVLLSIAHNLARKYLRTNWPSLAKATLVHVKFKLRNFLWIFIYNKILSWSKKGLKIRTAGQETVFYRLHYWVLVKATPDTPAHFPLFRCCNIFLKRLGYRRVGVGLKVASEWVQYI